MATEIKPLIQQYTVDFASNNNFLFVKGVQGDGYGTRYVDISLMNNGQPYEIDKNAVWVVIRGTKPDNSSIFNKCEILDDCTIRVEITQQMSAVPGKGDYEISITSLTENRTLTSFPFFIMISQSSFDVSYVTSSDEFQLLVDKINEVDSIEKHAESLINEQVILKQELEQSIQESQTATDATKIATSESIIATNSLKTYHDEVKNAEAIRVNNEHIRESNEEQRIANENQRIINEETRENNEDIRLSNEAVRENNETIRIDNENTRNANEIERNINEENRLNNEAIRDANEEERKENETSRIQQAIDYAEEELTRKENEQQRIDNEEIRQRQESERQANTATAISNANDATDAALNAVKNIQEKIGINDNPTDEQAGSVVYSAQKVNSLISDLQKVYMPLVVDNDGNKYQLGKDNDGIFLLEIK